MVKGKSDPYVKINIGGETFTSQVIKTNLNPTWNEMYEVNKNIIMLCYNKLNLSTPVVLHLSQLTQLCVALDKSICQTIKYNVT